MHALSPRENWNCNACHANEMGASPSWCPSSRSKSSLWLRSRGNECTSWRCLLFRLPGYLTYITVAVIFPMCASAFAGGFLIKSFFDRGTEDVFNRRNSKEARRTCPPEIWRVAQRKLDQLNAAVSLGSLGIPPGNQLESLKGKRVGQHAIRINDQFRVCFIWSKDGPERVEITNYH
jgi:proteic killer suppression protein